MKTYCVYLLGNARLTVFYVGVTNNIERRMFEHKTRVNKRSFSARYNVNRLMYFEEFNNIRDAIRREKQLKKYTRQ